MNIETGGSSKPAKTSSPSSPPSTCESCKELPPKHTRDVLPSVCHHLGEEEKPWHAERERIRIRPLNHLVTLDWNGIFFLGLTELHRHSTSLYILILLLRESLVSMKQFAMQIEAWEGMDAAPCTLVAAAAVFSSLMHKFGDYHYRNNSPGAKLGLNFDGNRSLWLIMELITGDEQCVGPGDHCYRTPAAVTAIHPHVLWGMWIFRLGPVYEKWLLSLVI
ncbi:uncharacterized protein LOC142098127 [Mixophyes fleayi]|uniref:uncharacterized protein LOC142098127 n=1 Tax=Mixophyes fleayi TaxID=3061075 RepID=UPI003F4DA81A